MVILEPGRPSDDDNQGNGGYKKYYLVRGYTLLFLGVGLIVWGIWPPIDPAIFTFGGSLVGLNPVLKAQEKR
jgi:hypothetical protein